MSVVMRVWVRKADWEEGQHPRAADGKFGEGGAGGGKGGKKSEGEKVAPAPKKLRATKAPKTPKEDTPKPPAEAAPKPVADSGHVPPPFEPENKVTVQTAAPTPEQVRSLKGYVHSGYLEINRAARGVLSTPETNEEREKHAQIQAKIAHMDAMMDASKLSAPITVYRGAKGGTIGEVQVGSTWTEKGFSSTSENKETAKTFLDGGRDSPKMPRTLVTMKLAAGQKAIYPNHFCPNKYGANEREIILPRDTKYEVTAVRMQGNVRHITVKVRPNS